MINRDQYYPSYEHRMTRVHLRFLHAVSPDTVTELEKIAEFGYQALFRASISLIDLKAACERSNDCQACIDLDNFMQAFPAAVPQLNRAIACFRKDWRTSHQVSDSTT
jgi:hypothetical protein